jgi:endonuclease IV
MYFGIKTSLNPTQIKNKLLGLSEKPNLIEVHLFDSDIAQLDEKLSVLRKAAPSAKIVFHCPYLDHKGAYMDLTDVESLQLLIPLYELCKANSDYLGVVLHPEYSKMTERNVALSLIKTSLTYLDAHIPYFRDYSFFENNPGVWGKTLSGYLEILTIVNAQNICFDVSHFAAYNSQDEFYRGLKELKKRFKTVYYHLSDHYFADQNTKALNIGKGQIDFEELLIDLELGIVETLSRDEDLGEEIKEDYKKIKEILDMINPRE